MRVSVRILGWYHVAGAVAGGVLTLWAWSQGVVLFGSLWSAALPFALTMAAGRALLDDRKWARLLAYIVQLLQIPIVILPAITWKFIAGIIASLTIGDQGPRLYGGVEATWFVGSGNLGGLPITLGINVVPIIVMVLLFRSHKLERRDLAAAAPASRPAG